MYYSIHASLKIIHTKTLTYIYTLFWRIQVIRKRKGFETKTDCAKNKCINLYDVKNVIRNKLSQPFPIFRLINCANLITIYNTHIILSFQIECAKYIQLWTSPSKIMCKLWNSCKTALEKLGVTDVQELYGSLSLDNRTQPQEYMHFLAKLVMYF